MGWMGGGRALNKAQSMENCQKLQVNPLAPALREMGRTEQRTEKIWFAFLEDHSGYCDEIGF